MLWSFRMDIAAPFLFQSAKAQPPQSQTPPDSLLFSGRKKSKSKAVEWKKGAREELNLDHQDRWQKSPLPEVKPEPAEDCLVWVKQPQLPDSAGDGWTSLKAPQDALKVDPFDWKPMLPGPAVPIRDFAEEADAIVLNPLGLPQWPTPVPEVVQSVMAAIQADEPIPQDTLDAYDQQRGVADKAPASKATRARKNAKRNRPEAEKPELRIYESALPPFDEAYYRHNPFKKSYLERQALLAQKQPPMILSDPGVAPELSLQVLSEMIAELNQLPTV
jgi:hypothetical protein